MEISKNKFAMAAASTMGVWYIICALIVSIAPDFALAVFGWMIHLVNLETAVSGGVAFPGVIFGFVAVVVLAYLTAYVFAWFYNRLCAPRSA